MNRLHIGITTYKNLTDIAVTGRTVEGCLKDGVDFDATRNELDQYGLLLSHDNVDRTIEFNFPSGFFATFRDFLRAGSRREKVLEEFYIAENDCYYQGNTEKLPEVVRNYISLVGFYQLLATVADFKNIKGSDSEDLVFISDSKTLTLTSMYSEHDLVDLPEFHKFIVDFLTTEIHVHQKQSIIKNALLDIFQSRESITLAEVVRNFKEIKSYTYKSYQLYVSEFSFNKVKASVDESRLEYTKKINKVFSEIQNQILTVPLALIIVAGQMTPSESWSVKNLSIWLGSLVFTVLVVLLIKNQRETLNAIERELKHQWAEIKRKHFDAFSKFEDIYTDLTVRINKQFNVLRMVEFICYSGLAASTTILLYNKGILQIVPTLLICSIPLLSTLVIGGLVVYFASNTK